MKASMKDRVVVNVSTLKADITEMAKERGTNYTAFHYSIGVPCNTLNHAKENYIKFREELGYPECCNGIYGLVQLERLEKICAEAELNVINYVIDMEDDEDAEVATSEDIKEIFNIQEPDSNTEILELLRQAVSELREIKEMLK